MNFSIIIPIYNRPDELKELLESLCRQTEKNFEVIVIDDGSSEKCDAVCDEFKNDLKIEYFFQKNSGPALARNHGAKYAHYDYLLFFDSDCIIPPDYFQKLEKHFSANYVDAFGGPDAATESFSDIQKAINYSMTSPLTTGGIRGGKKKVKQFCPRTFNMGISKDAFQQLKGFSKMRFGEDVDFSLRLYEAGKQIALFQDLFVYHKRRTDFKKFFKQVYNSGMARIDLWIRHPQSLKLVHLLPSLFFLSMLFILIASFFNPKLLLLPLLFSLFFFLDALSRTHSVSVAALSIVASWIQLCAYGMGFIHAFITRKIFKKGQQSVFEKNFYD